ncbi:MAG: hypothetical protein IKV79_07500 [Oscillospiraceae bacterium]|nr:hypothetical protein [Oscillospiraceae bacterium]
MRKAFVLLAFLFLFQVPVWASYGSENVASALEGSASEIMGNMDLDSFSVEGLAQALWNYLHTHFSSEIKNAIKPVGILVVVAVLCSVGDGLQNKKEIDYVNLAGVLAIAIATVQDVNSVSAMARDALLEMQEFSRVLLPVLASASVSAGAISSAAVKYAASALFMDVLISTALKVLLPLLGAYTAVLIASSATGDGRLKGAVKLLKWLCKIALTALVSAFTFYIGIAGIAASGADAAATKAAKAIISNFVPVVGKMVSGASDTIAAGAMLIRSSVGVFGLGAVIAMCAAPFLAIGLRYLLFKAVAAVVCLVAGDRISSLVEGLGAVYGMLLGLVGVGAVFMFISILSLIKVVA